MNFIIVYGFKKKKRSFVKFKEKKRNIFNN